MACSAAPATVLSQTDLYVDRGPPAAAQAQEWAEQGRDADAERMRVIAAQPIAEWLTSPTGSIRADVEQFVGRARGSARCWSPTTCRPGTAAASRAAGPDGADYRAWVREIAGALGGGRAVIVLEPDAVPHEPTGCVAPEMVA